ncbi:MAG TPA: glycerate kinase [Micropepsaceae bacterium]|nr:glycerate kinase [Micropepsaceae bacterium]
MDPDPRAVLLRLFHVAVNAASAANCVPPNLPAHPPGRTIVIGAGKAAAAMAKAVEDHWRGPLSGLVITRYGHGVPCREIEVVEAGHPVPDEAGAAAAERMLSLVQGLSKDDLVLALISGGGSSLFALPAPGVALSDKQAVTRALLKSGARIAEINCVRKHLSAVKGGRLALAAQPATVMSLIISDVPGDDPETVASGPTAPDSTTREQALAILNKYEIAIPAAVKIWLESPASETPKPGHPAFARVQNHIIARARDALSATASEADAMGFRVVDLGDAIEGEARLVARTHAELALRQRAEEKSCVLISGGETTVTVKGQGRGGRNSEYLLALALALDGAAGIWAIACDTDGIDGTEANAGAIIGPDTLARGKALGADGQAALARNDSYGFFAALSDLVETGPTRTNVNDFRAILVRPS